MRYDTGVPLGRGGMSEVLEAWDPQRQQTVALKLLSRDDPELAERMLGEARAQALVDHPNVCEVYEVGWLDGRPYIAMQRVDGTTLDRAAEAMSLEQKVRLMRTVADAVHAAHRVGLIHRDLKPGNILVEKADGGFKPYVVDFGIARRQEVPGLTLTGQLLGTPGYMSPEQARGETRRLDRRSDVFQLGVVLYELLAGEPPFSGDSRVETLIQILEKEPPPLRRKAPFVPAALGAVVGKCLEKEPERRYGSARELAQDLDRFLDGQPVRARPVGLVGWLTRRARRHPAFAGLAALALAALLALTGLWLSTRWNAAERALLARRLGQQVERLDAVVRFTHLAPAHDIRATRRGLESQLAAMSAELAELPRSLTGVGAAAVGRGHLALGDLHAARRLLERAWDAGERGPEVAQDLGLVTSELYREQRERAASLRDPELRRAAEEEAERRFKVPALRYLAIARRDPARAPKLLAARIAWIEGRWEEAEQRAHQALEELPWLYEAAILEGDVARSRALEQRSSGETAGMLASFEDAADAYRRAGEIGSSDPLPWERLCALHGCRMEVAYFDRGEPVEPLFAEVQAACGQALAIDPARPRPHVLIASAAALASRALTARGEDPRPALARSLDSATRALEQCTSRAPARGASPTQVSASRPGDCGSVRADAYRRRGDAWAYLAEWERQHGEDPRASLAEAIRDLERAVHLAPRDPGAFNSLGLAHWERLELARGRGQDPLPAYRVAVATFQRAAELLPGYTHAHSNLGAIHRLRVEHEIQRGGDPEPFFAAAVASFRRALEANPSNSHALNNLGSVFLERGHYELERGRDPTQAFGEALELYRRASERKADWAFPHFNRGLAHRALGEYALRRGQDPRPHLQRAEAAFDAGHALRDDLALTHVELGRVHLVEAQWAGRPGSPTPGKVLETALERGLERAARALALHPREAEGWLLRGRLELLAAQVRASGRASERAPERAPEREKWAADPGTARRLARRAAAALSQALEINPALEPEIGPALAEARSLAGSQELDPVEAGAGG